MIQLEIANINLLERIKKGQVNFMKKKITVILMVILIGIMAAGCGQQQKTEQTAGTEESASQDIFAMDTYMSVTAYGADAEPDSYHIQKNSSPGHRAIDAAYPDQERPAMS